MDPAKTGGSCTSSVRIIPSPEQRVLYHRFPIQKGQRWGRRPAVPRTPAARATVALRDPIWGGATASSRDGPSPWPPSPVGHEAFPRPEAVSGSHDKAALWRL